MNFLYNPKVLETLLRDTHLFFLFRKHFVHVSAGRKLKNIYLVKISTYVTSMDKYFTNNKVRPSNLKFLKPGSCGYLFSKTLEILA